MSFIKDYFVLTKQYIDEYGQNTILLMQCGAFFEVYGLKDKTDLIYGSNIIDFARICDLNVVDKKVCVGTDAVVLSGFKDHLVDKYVKRLQENGYTIAVYAQNDPIEGVITRSLLGVFSPGTYFSPEPDNITNKTCCIWIQTQKKSQFSILNSNNKNDKVVYVGVSIIDIYTGKTSIMEYSEQYIKNPTTFDELERFISIHCPSETIIISNLGKDVIDIVSYINIKSKCIHYVNLLDTDVNNVNVKRAINCEKQIYQTQLLKKFYKFDDIVSFMSIFCENIYATQSFCYLLDFIYQHNPNLVYKISEPTIANDSNQLILANHSLKQLNIIDDDNYGGKYSSVVKMLNECITPMGKRKFTHCFLNPVTNISYLQSEYDIIDILLNDPDEYLVIKQMLIGFKDIAKINRQIMLKKISPRFIYQLYNATLMTKIIYNFVLGNNELTNYLRVKLGDVFENLLVHADEISTFLDNVLIMEECKDIDNVHKIEKSFIKNGVDADLDKKIMTLMESEDQLECCRSYFSSIIANYETSGAKRKTKVKDVSIETDTDAKDSFVKIHETEKNNFSLVATDRRCKILEEVLLLNKSTNVRLKYQSTFFKEEKEFILELGKGVIDFSKQSTTSRFITSPQIGRLCKDVSSIKINLIDAVSKVYNKIINDIETFQERIEIICDFITYVDLVYAKTFIAVKYNYCKPNIVPLSATSKKSYIKVTKMRHCLIEKIQQNELYVANDITLGKSEGLDGQGLNGILLYGTNAVGKTSFIRALGISVIMAQAGLYVPASSFEFYPYKYIFTRIIGNDNLFKGLSTFAVEMSELRTILRLADERSLVLGDELCSGTESISAASIFVAGIQMLQQKTCSFIFATHLHEITNYDEITSLHNVGCKHMSVIYDKEKDLLIYDRKLKDGPGTNMYGLEVCKSLNLPQDFLDLAHNIRMKYNPESNSLLDQKSSHFNAKHIKGMCEKCNKKMATEVHHLQYQQDADDKGIIKNAEDGLTFHKNHPANLLSICEQCHDEIHKTGKKLKKVKTTKGVIVMPL
jgi:DNA mismatch repair protein MutS